MLKSFVKTNMAELLLSTQKIRRTFVLCIKMDPPIQSTRTINVWRRTIWKEDLCDCCNGAAAAAAVRAAVAAAVAATAAATTAATTATTATATVTATAGEDNLEPTRMLGRMTIAKQKKKKCVQLKTTGLWLFKRLAKNVCEVTYVVNLIDKVSDSHSVSARLDEDEHTRGGSCVLAADIMATSTTKLTHSIHIRLNRSFCSCLIKNAPHFARRRETFPLQSSTPTLTAR